MAIHIVIDGYNLIGGEKRLRGKGAIREGSRRGKESGERGLKNYDRDRESCPCAGKILLDIRPFRAIEARDYG